MKGITGKRILFFLGFVLLLWQGDKLQYLTLSSTGLIADCMGAWLIGHSFFRKSMEQILDETNELLDGNEDKLFDAVEQRFDVVWGTSFLVVGFSLQILGAWMSEGSEGLSVIALFFVLAVFILYLLKLRHLLICRWIHPHKGHLSAHYAKRRWHKRAEKGKAFLKQINDKMSPPPKT